MCQLYQKRRTVLAYYHKLKIKAEDLCMNILVVDDSSTMRRIVSNALNNIGYNNITLAEDGSDALKKIKATQFDAIMTDWNMPKMDGLSLVREVRKMPNYQEVPIVMITTEGGKREVITAIKEGVNNYIVKPFTAQTLKNKLEDII
jgi:two-component system chemotaxis response regulator CheY